MDAPERIWVENEAGDIREDHWSYGTSEDPERPNEYTEYVTKAHCDALIAAAYEAAFRACIDQFHVHVDLVVTGCPENAKKRESAANMAEKLAHEIRALTPTDAKEALDRIVSERDALIAENERLREALTIIATHTQKCHEHDDDMGHDRREFDWEDVAYMQRIARAALTGDSDND